MPPHLAAPSRSQPRHRRFVLLTLCLAAFTINLDTTIVNVTLPTLVRDLDAVDPRAAVDRRRYNLVFAALVLAAGSLSDRLGRKGALLAGLGLFAAGSLLGSAAELAGPAHRGPGRDRPRRRDHLPRDAVDL